MFGRIRSRLTYANAMATVAVFIALGGVSYAAVKLPKNSVGRAQIQADAVTGAKVKNSSLTGSDIKDRSLSAADFKSAVQRPASPQGPKGDPGAKGDTGGAGPPGNDASLQRIRDVGASASGGDPAADPDGTIFEVAKVVKASGIYETRVSDSLEVNCPSAGGCELTSGLYVDGQPVPATKLGPFTSPSGVSTAGVFGGSDVQLSAGSHVFALKYKQTTGQPATITPLPGWYSVEITGPYSP